MVVAVVVAVGMIRRVTMSIFLLHRPWSSLWPCMKPTALTTSDSWKGLNKIPLIVKMTELA
jgi:hypothetical protein